MSYSLPMHLICTAIITKDEGLCYGYKNIRHLQLDQFSKVIYPIQPPTTLPFQRITTTIIQYPLTLPCRYKTPIIPLIPTDLFLNNSHPLILQTSKKQYIQTICINKDSNFSSTDNSIDNNILNKYNKSFTKTKYNLLGFD